MNTIRRLTLRLLEFVACQCLGHHWYIKTFIPNTVQLRWCGRCGKTQSSHGEKWKTIKSLGYPTKEFINAINEE